MEQNERKFLHPLELLAIAYERADEKGRKEISQGLERITYGLTGATIGLPIGVAGAILTAFAYQESPAAAEAIVAGLVIGTPFLGAKIGEYIYNSRHRGIQHNRQEE